MRSVGTFTRAGVLIRLGLLLALIFGITAMHTSVGLSMMAQAAEMTDGTHHNTPGLAASPSIATGGGMHGLMHGCTVALGSAPTPLVTPPTLASDAFAAPPSISRTLRPTPALLQTADRTISLCVLRI